MNTNYMQVGKSVSFSFIKNGKKVHYVPDGELITLCGFKIKGINYPYEKQKKKPDICRTCEQVWKLK